jgi:hypothetical protein
MGNRWWLPEGEHLRIYLILLLSIDLEGVEPRLFCPKEPFIHPILTNELEQL